MSQSATFYQINSNDFSAIKRNRKNLELLKDNDNYVVFQGTHEGLRYILSKGRDWDETSLVNEIFCPSTYIGEDSKYVFPVKEEVHEFKNVTGDVFNDNLDSEPVLYHNPQKIKQIADLLNTKSDEHFAAIFDPEELNRENIYPWCWNANTGDDQAFNRRHLLEDYRNLKKLFNSANWSNNYLLCFVG